MSDLTTFNPSKVPARIKERKGELSAMAKALAGNSGNSSKRISIKGGVFRLMSGGKQIGKMDDRHMDVVVVNAAPKVSRVLYLKKWDGGDSTTAPDCWSNDGEKPDASIDEPQHTNCADCDQNVAGSGEGNSRKCRFQQRVAVVLPNDMDGDVMQLAVPGASLFGKGSGDDRPLQEYARFLAASGIDPNEVITQISFDTDSESPKLFFKPKRWLTDEEHEVAVKQGDSPEAKSAVVMTVAQQDSVSAPAPAIEGTRPQKAKPATVAEDDTDDEEEDEPAPPKAAKKAKPAAVVEDDTDDEDEAPAVRKPAAKKAAAPAKSSLADMAAQWDDED